MFQDGELHWFPRELVILHVLQYVDRRNAEKNIYHYGAENTDSSQNKCTESETAGMF